jgi:hypothetical protein
MSTFFCFKKVGLVLEGLEQGPPESHQKFYPESEPEPHKNDAAPQHWPKPFFACCIIKSCITFKDEKYS